MPISMNKNVWISITVIFVILCIGLFALFYFQDIFVILLLGLCILAVVDKCIKFYNKHTTKLTRTQRRVGAVAVIIALIVGTVVFVYTQMASFSSLFDDMTNIQNMIEEGTQIILAIFDVLPESIINSIEETVKSLTDAVFGMLMQMLSKALYYILGMILLYPIMFRLYFKDRGRIKTMILGMVPKKFSESFGNASSAILTQINKFFVAKVIESIALAVITSVGFFLLGIPGWLFLGILFGLLNNVPYIGPWISTIPPLLIGLAISWQTAILVLVVSLIAQAIDNYYLVPYMISDKVSVSPFTTVILVLVFAQLFGALGMILSIPFYIIFKIILMESYKQLVQMFPDDAAKTTPPKTAPE
ncbi:putative transport protein YhhT [Methanosarcinaceae archaeon Ag5]|uniref:Transport protein YhhT n=2 Tax=Methanolapillus africanus TaxID=3028297 RepID=A0AAE4MIY3_9EURY|nr:putative transport protein YhhT [Methanosarcinaceae archaeon Ag5]